MQIHEMLLNRKREIEDQLRTLVAESEEIERLLVAAKVPAMASASVASVPVRAATISKDEAIMQALRAGIKTPARIADYMKNELGLDVNQASTRTRLSRMKADGKIKHDGEGWTL